MEEIRNIHQRLERIETKIDQLVEFRISTIVTTRYTSMIVSGICGLLTMIATTFLHYYFLRD